ncbi:DUF1810 domain-containing protein [Ferruginibacter profundus]
MDSLDRFIKAQESKYDIALSEIKNGEKETHWMWYVFPQIKGLGISDKAKFYALEDIAESISFLNHPILGNRLLEISTALLQLTSNDANKIMGSPDDVKLRSCMTLFNALPDTHTVFKLVLDKFYNGKEDEATLQIINQPL